LHRPRSGIDRGDRLFVDLGVHRIALEETIDIFSACDLRV